MAIQKRTVVICRSGDSLIPSQWAQVVDSKAGMLWEPFQWQSGNRTVSGGMVGVAPEIDDICRVDDLMFVDFANRFHIMGTVNGLPLHGGFQTLRN